MIHVSRSLVLMALLALLAACGNKGELVKPAPTTGVVSASAH